jgi:hypothetical protein
MDSSKPSTLAGALAVGTRLRCPSCGSELIVVTKGEADLSCCAQAPVPVIPPKR